MASALGNWAMKTHTLGAGQFVEFILTREWNEAMKMMRTAEILNEDMMVAVVICNLSNCQLTWKKKKSEFNRRHYNILRCLLWGSRAWTW